MKILFLSRWFPYPPSNGSKLRIYSLLLGLSQEHEVTLICFDDLLDDRPIPIELQRICSRVHVIPWKPFTPNSGRALLGYLSLKPRSVVDTFSSKMARCIQSELVAEKHALVIASQINMGVYHHYFSGVPAIFEEVELASFYDQFAHTDSFRQRLRYGLTWVKHKKFMVDLLPHFGACTVVSEQEQQLLQDITADNDQIIEIIPNCVNVAEYDHVDTEAQPNTLIYTGSFTYFPNYQAMKWFLEQVYPAVQAEVPDVHLIITGDHANLRLPMATNVTLTGFVDDVRPYVAASSISLAPIWTGGGTRLKILEAMALRTPVVATPKGAEGLDVEHDKHVLIADGAAPFASAVIRLLRDSNLQRRLSDNSYRLVTQKYDWKVVMPRFLQLVEQVANS